MAACIVHQIHGTPPRVEVHPKLVRPTGSVFPRVALETWTWPAKPPSREMYQDCRALLYAGVKDCVAAQQERRAAEDAICRPREL